MFINVFQVPSSNIYGRQKGYKTATHGLRAKRYREMMIVDFAPVIVFFNHRCLLILQKKLLVLFLAGVSRYLACFKNDFFVLH